MAGNKGGRPQVYRDREMVWGYIDGARRAEINQLAEDLGLSRSRVVAAMLEFALRHPGEVVFPPGKPEQDQEELPLKAS